MLEVKWDQNSTLSPTKPMAVEPAPLMICIWRCVSDRSALAPRRSLGKEVSVRQACERRRRLFSSERAYGGCSLLPLPLQFRDELLEVFPLAQGIEIGVFLQLLTSL